MPEPLTEPTPEVELATLRKVHAEVLQTKREQKARITALEADLLAATEKADKAQSAAHAAVVDLPLKRMVAELSSNVPDLVMRELLEDFNFAAGDDGSIIITNKTDGKPIAAKEGKAVAWTKHDLWSFLIGWGYETKSDRQRVYTHLLGIPAGSGGAGRKPVIGQRTSVTSEEKPAGPHFGLR